MGGIGKRFRDGICKFVICAAKRLRRAEMAGNPEKSRKSCRKMVLEGFGRRFGAKNGLKMGGKGVLDRKWTKIHANGTCVATGGSLEPLSGDFRQD